MSSTQIQLERDRVVSVQTQSITALNSVRKGTIRKLEVETTREKLENSPYKLFNKIKYQTENNSQTFATLYHEGPQFRTCVFLKCVQSLQAVSGDIVYTKASNFFFTLGRGRGSGSWSSWWGSCPGCGLGSHIWFGRQTGRSRYTLQSTRAEQQGYCWTSCRAKSMKTSKITFILIVFLNDLSFKNSNSNWKTKFREGGFNQIIRFFFFHLNKILKKLVEYCMKLVTSLWPRGGWRTSRSVYRTPAPLGKHTFPAETSSGRGLGLLS